MNLFNKIFWTADKFSKQTTGKFILGALIYVAQTLIALPLMACFGLGYVVMWHATFGTFVLILKQLDVIDADDNFVDVFKKVFPLSYKFAADKESFMKALAVHIVAVLLPGVITSVYALIGLVLLIVEYCKNNKKADAVEEAKAE